MRTSTGQFSLTKWAPPLRPVATTDASTIPPSPPPPPPPTSQGRGRSASAAALHESLQLLAQPQGDAEHGAAAAAGGGGGGADTGRGAQGGDGAGVLFTPQLGYLQGGRELREGFLTILQASEWCAARARCLGFSTRAPEPGTPLASVTYVQFRSTAEVGMHSGWYAWTKPVARGAGHKEEL